MTFNKAVSLLLLKQLTAAWLNDSCHDHFKEVGNDNIKYVITIHNIHM